MSKWALVTGASSGIGWDTSIELAKEGYNIFAIARRGDRLNTLYNTIKDKYDVEVISMPFDLSQVSNYKPLYEELSKHDFSVVVNNAGFGSFSFIEDMEDSNILEMIRLNVEALTLLTHYFVKNYINKELTIINLGSIAGYRTYPGASVYSATKFYVSALTESLNYELEDTEIYLKVMAPAATKTEFIGKATNNKYNKTDYDTIMPTAADSETIARYIIELINSNKVVGLVNFKTMELELSDSHLPTVGFNKEVISKLSK